MYFKRKWNNHFRLLLLVLYQWQLTEDQSVQEFPKEFKQEITQVIKQFNIWGISEKQLKYTISAFSENNISLKWKRLLAWSLI